MNRDKIIIIGVIVALSFTVTGLLLQFYEDSRPKKVHYNDKGEVSSIYWLDKNDRITGGYVRVENGWLVWSTEASGFVLVPEDRWSPPETDEPVTLEKFPPNPSKES